MNDLARLVIDSTVGALTTSVGVSSSSSSRVISGVIGVIGAGGSTGAGGVTFSFLTFGVGAGSTGAGAVIGAVVVVDFFQVVVVVVFLVPQAEVLRIQPILDLQLQVLLLEIEQQL